jgi:hypothetical protein
MTRLLFAILALAVVTPNVSAVLIKVTDPTSPGGADNVTHDTASGLYWLDWNASQNVSYTDMVAMLGVGGVYEGWRHATRGEILALPMTVGLSTANYPNSTSMLDNGEIYGSFSDFVGVTSEFAWDNTVYGTSRAIFDIYTPINDVVEVFTAYQRLDNDRSATVRSLMGGVSTPFPGAGHALVRTSLSAVPEPSIALIGAIVSSGLMATVGRRRR